MSRSYYTHHRMPEVGDLLFNAGEQERYELVLIQPPPLPEPRSTTMTKRPTPTLKSVGFKFDEVTLSQIEWLIHFSKELSVPGTSKKMVIARAIDLYVELAEDLLVTYQCTPKAKDITQERQALMQMGEGRVSVLRSAELPEIDRGTADRLPTYSAIVKDVTQPSKKKSKLPGVYIPKHKRAAVEQILEERAGDGK